MALDEAESAATIAAYAAQQVMEREIAEMAARIERERIEHEGVEMSEIQEKLTEEMVEKGIMKSKKKV